MTPRTTLALLATALLGGACDPDDKARANEEARALPADLDTTALARRSLSASSLPQMHLLASPGGRDLLSHIVACALPAGTSLTTISRDGTPYSFFGRLGLAPTWAQHPPTAIEQHRVTACVRVQIVGLTEA